MKVEKKKKKKKNSAQRSVGVGRMPRLSLPRARFCTNMDVAYANETLFELPTSGG